MRVLKASCLLLILLLPGGCRVAEVPIAFFRPLMSDASHSEAMCTLRVVTIPRSQLYLFERMWRYMDVGGLQGASHELLAMNGLKLAKTDPRFSREFHQIIDSMRKTQDVPEYFRLYEGLDQTFGIGPIFEEDTLSVWSTPNSVIMRHFRDVRYRMKLQVEVLREGLGDFHVSWEARTGAGLRMSVSLSPMAVTASLENNQSLVVSPADFTGRGLGKAFISGVGDAAEQITFLILTPSVIRKKTEKTES